MTQWQFWIDRGGTFTDIVARTPDGQHLTMKLLSEAPDQYKDAAIEGMRRFLKLGPDQALADFADQIKVVKMGTTVATNALLERKGEPTLLVVNRGFKDLLRIGTQNRPELFARHIQLPEMLYRQVLEVPERLSVSGQVLLPLDEDAAKAGLQQAFDAGFRSVAIVLLHAWRYPAHEIRLGEIARQIGFTQISLSHQASPLMKVVGRGDTTVLDAYLSPILRRYVDQVAGQLGGAKLMFMQSSGGLADANAFQGKDAILSGPAGGVVGAVQTARMAGLDKIIGFDMGGTSTDVCHFNGQFERSFETQVAGVRVRAPMMNIHTVAAGGGSIIRFDGARLRVGPESAGANPGPASYRRGGPLTVTDCNVLLGRIQPEYFPHVFGPNADQPLDLAVVQEKFAQLASQTGKSAEELAEGALAIAVMGMANVIKQVSVARGYDVSRYGLVSFGGAGGQHACAVADALNMDCVFLHPLAGVLSAYGMGLADLRVIREAAIELPLDAKGVTQAALQAHKMAANALVELRDQGVEQGITVLTHAFIKYAGSDTSLELRLSGADQLQQDFEELHHQRFGFIQQKPLMIEAIRVEAFGGGEALAEPDQPLAPDPAVLKAHGRMWSKGGFVDVPIFERDDLKPGQSVTGPALILESIGTNVIEAGWQAQMNAKGHLLLKRIVPRAKVFAAGTDQDPILLEVFNNLYMSVAEQMGAVLANTAHSVNIKERLDFSCAVFDGMGGLVANAPHIPVHLGSMGESVREVLRRFNDLKPGDSFILNSPYTGGTHLPDITVVTPVFIKGQPMFFVASRGHHADIGGITPGSMPPFSTSIDQEGILIEPQLLVSEGIFREAAMRQLFASTVNPARNVDQNIADLQAQLAANEKGVQELLKMADTFGVETTSAYMRYVQMNAEESVRRAIAKLNDGHFAVTMDDGAEIRVSVRIDRDNRRATLDFTGTSAQRPGNANAPKSITRAAVLYVFRTIIDDAIPLNEGCLAPIDIIIPEGSLLAPVYPAAVVAGNVETSQALVDALMGALGVMAASQGTMNNLTFGDQMVQYYETICGGSGAGPDFDGTDAVQTHMTNSRLTDPEIMEWRYPVLIDGFGIRPNSGGQGRQRGGNGVIRRIKFLKPMQAAILSNRRKIAPFGLAGGGDGKCGENYVLRADGSRENLDHIGQIMMQEGDVLVIETPGGGGFGT